MSGDESYRHARPPAGTITVSARPSGDAASVRAQEWSEAKDSQALPSWVDIRFHPVDASTKAGTAISFSTELER